VHVHVLRAHFILCLRKPHILYSGRAYCNIPSCAFCCSEKQGSKSRTAFLSYGPVSYRQDVKLSSQPQVMNEALPVHNTGLRCGDRRRRTFFSFVHCRDKATVGLKKEDLGCECAAPERRLKGQSQLKMYGCERRCKREFRGQKDH
jgi:hypothetical protein